MNWYLEVLRKYAVFSGRARRKEYWYFVLIHHTIIMILDSIGKDLNPVAILVGIYGLAVMIPYLAVAVRRLHDTDHSGWWLFIALIPFIGFIILLIFLVRDSDPNTNQYGANPKLPPTPTGSFMT
jgi:uncharacterized membrane protein YhaH (DUF805 family)